MKILVTGGAGFIGSHVCDRLLKEGHEVICLDDFNDYYSPEKKRKNIEHNKKNRNFKLVKKDIRENLDAVFENRNINAIIHLAARAGVRPSLENPNLYFDVNVTGTVNILETARKYSVNRIVFASSSSVYGANTKTPFSETDIIEKQISPYALTKKIGEIICKNYSDIYGMNITCLRFFTVYGERGRPDMAPYKFFDLIYNDKPITMFGDGTTKRDYTYVEDIVEGIILALNKNMKFEIINLGNSKPILLKDFISAIEKITLKKANIIKQSMQKGDVDITFADISKANKLLGYKPKTTVENGMRNFSKWYIENR